MAWTLLKNFAVLWTIVMIVATVVYINIASKGISDVNNEWAMAGAGIGMTVALAMLGAVWFFPAVGAAILGFFLKKSTVVENSPTGPMANSDVHTLSAETRNYHYRPMLTARNHISQPYI